MPVYREKNGTYTARFYIETIDSARKQQKKRGFKTSREAKRYEADFLTKKLIQLKCLLKNYMSYILKMCHID